MRSFVDLHNHMLYGVDDGASSQEMMLAMLDMSYADGVRAICLTPHFAPHMFGKNYACIPERFSLLEEIAAKKYPDLKLFLGNELGYYHGCEEKLRRGTCRTLAGGKYVLVDFPAHAEFFEIQQALNRLRAEGYCTVLAHAERYKSLFSHFSWFEDYVADGGLIQINASVACVRRFSSTRAMWKKLLKEDLVHVIASDGHNLDTRSPKMSVCSDYLARHLSKAQIEKLTFENPWRILENKNI